MSAPPATLTAALIGNPNTGKSTLFNALAGMRTHVGNYPGVTVEKKVGRVKWEGQQIEVVDLPGTYSLAPRSLDEVVTIDVLLGRRPEVGQVDVVVCVVDASNLERNLYLVSQVLSLGVPVVVALNMADVARVRGVEIDAELLGRRLGVKVVATEGHRRLGLDALKQAVLASARSGAASPPQVFPEAFAEAADAAAALIGRETPRGLVERLLIDRGGALERELLDEQGLEKLEAIRVGLAERQCAVPAVEARARYGWIRRQLDGAVVRPQQRPQAASDRIDRVLTHGLLGFLAFLAVMFVVFQAIYTWSAPLMGAVESAQGWVAGQVAGWMSPGPLRSLLIDGVVAGVGSVLVFIPQIAVLFLFIALLEDCGYMARAAFLMDRLMTRIGLSGKSFVPLMSSFACAIPGIMAARVIENRRDRMVTILIAPLMSCSARVPVYVLLIYTFIPQRDLIGGWGSLQGLVLFVMTFVGLAVAVPVAWLLKKFVFPGKPSPLVMELPDYKLPTPRIVLHRAYDRSLAFATRAGTLIFATTVLIWAAGYFPGDHSEHHRLQAQLERLERAAGETPGGGQAGNAAADSAADAGAAAADDNVAAAGGEAEGGEAEGGEAERLRRRLREMRSELLRGSALGRMGRAVEPVVRPLGWDWRIGVGAIASFPAREVIIATLGTIYSLGGDVDEMDEGLKDAMRSARWPDGRPVYNVPVALSILVFFALCAQCGATLMVMRRETNAWRWPVFTFTYMTVLAYVAALIVYQVSIRLV